MSLDKDRQVKDTEYVRRLQLIEHEYEAAKKPFVDGFNAATKERRKNNPDADCSDLYAEFEAKRDPFRDVFLKKRTDLRKEIYGDDYKTIFGVR